MAAKKKNETKVVETKPETEAKPETKPTIDSYASDVLITAHGVLTDAYAELNSFIERKKKDPTLSMGVTAMSKSLAIKHHVSTFFAYQLISAYVEMRPDVKVAKGKNGGFVTTEEWNARQAKGAADLENKVLRKFSVTARVLGFRDKKHFEEAKKAFNDRPTIGQLKEWIARQPKPSPDSFVKEAAPIVNT